MNVFCRRFGGAVALVRAAWVACVLLALPACPQAVKETGCTSDAECGEFESCGPTGECRCVFDDACDATEFCNAAGLCQQKLECLSDDDCATADNPAAICDTRAPIPEEEISVEDSARSRTAGQCVTLNAQSKQCLMDSHCPFGFFRNSGICQPGCRDNGDCTLGEPCIAGVCDAREDACNEPLYCEFGETCSDATATCAPHREAATLCQRCDPRELANPCPVSDGILGPTCLIDQGVVPAPCTVDTDCVNPNGGFDLCVPPQCFEDAECGAGQTCEGGIPGIGIPGQCSQGQCANFFCGTSACSDTDPCPRGYECTALIAVSGGSCTPGSGSAECGGNSFCLGGGETEEQGFCSCTSNTDCPPGGICSNPGPNGTCVIGTTCGPADGLTCADVSP